MLGVDTHRDIHVAVAVTGVGRLVDTKSFPTTAAGYRRMPTWARTMGVVRRAGVECTGSYGAALSRYLQLEGVDVNDVNQPDRAHRRKRGKTDAVDAESAARAVISGRSTAIAKTGDGAVDAMPCSSSHGTQLSTPAPKPSINSRPSWSALTRHCASR